MYLTEVLVGRLRFLFAILSGLAVDLAVGLAIGSADSISGNVAIGFS